MEVFDALVSDNIGNFCMATFAMYNKNGSCHWRQNVSPQIFTFDMYADKKYSTYKNYLDKF